MHVRSFLRYNWPLLIAIVFAVIMLVRGGAVLPSLLLLLLLAPIVTVVIQGCGARLASAVAAIVASPVGLLFGYLLGPTLSELLTGTVSPEDNIRIDLVLWWCVSASVSATIAASVVGNLSRRKMMQCCPAGNTTNL